MDEFLNTKNKEKAAARRKKGTLNRVEINKL